MKDGFERLLAEVGKELGLGEIAFDDQNICNLTIDDDYFVLIRRDDQRASLIFLGDVAQKMPASLEHVLWTDMLKIGLAPLRNEPALGIDPATGRLLLHQSMLLSTLDGYQLKENLMRFLSLQANWREKIAKAQAA
jgi:hypothetical protein